MDWTDQTTRRSFEGAARNYYFYGGWIWIFCLNWSRQDISTLDLQCHPPGSGHGSPKWGITRLYGRIFPERFVTKHSYQPSIKIIVSCGAFETASSGMVRLVHGTHPLIYSSTFTCIHVHIQLVLSEDWSRAVRAESWNSIHLVISYVIQRELVCDMW